jgi:hypothetical protein
MKYDLAVAWNFAHVTCSSSEYAGGMGMEWNETHYVIDLKAVKKLRLDDVITNTGQVRLHALIDRELGAQSKEKDGFFATDENFYSEDFYPEESGLWFQWDTSEIGSVSEGPFLVVLSWDEIADILTTKGKELAEAFRGNNMR